jgi:hypothetical protein
VINKQIIVNHLTQPITGGRSGGAGLVARTVGLQELAIVLINGFPAFNPIEDEQLIISQSTETKVKEEASSMSDENKIRKLEMSFIDVLLSNLTDERKTIYEPAAEVYGMILKQNAKDSHLHDMREKGELKIYELKLRQLLRRLYMKPK